MGYQTNYKLEISPPLEVNECPNKHPRRMPDDAFCPVCGEGYDTEIEVCDGLTIGELLEGRQCKWYDCEEDMVRFSVAHPGVLFTLDGEGEEAGDVWRKYFRDGLIQKWSMPKPEPEPFDEAKLVKP